jgi:putative inorganic carbon (HCO3(-)) transporter
MKSPLPSAAKFLASNEIWIVGAVVLLSIVRTSMLPGAVLIALLFWPIRWLADGVLSKRSPVDFGIALLILMIPVTLWATALPERTIPQVYRLALGILFFYALINWIDIQKKLGWIITGLLLAGVGLAAMAVISVRFATTKLSFIPASIYQQFELLISDTIHPNAMAGNIVILLPIGIALLFFTWKRLKNWQAILVLIATLIPTGMLVLTQSRGAIMGLGGALLIIVLLRWRWGWIAVPLALLGIVVIISQIGLDTALEFIATGVSIEGTEGRVEIWSRAIYMIQDFSFTGIGMGSYMEVADLLYPFFLAAPGKIVHAHNLLLQIAVDLGIPGFIGWFSIFLGVCLISWQLNRFGKANNDPWAGAIGAGFLGSQVALVLHGLMDAVTWGMIRPAPLVWGLWGTAIAAWMIMVHTHTPAQNTKVALQ